MNEPNTSNAPGVSSPKSASLSAAQASVEGERWIIRQRRGSLGTPLNLWSVYYVPECLLSELTHKEAESLLQTIHASLLRVAQAAQDSGDTDSGLCVLCNHPESEHKDFKGFQRHLFTPTVRPLGIAATATEHTTYGAWREADDLILFKLPGMEEFRISDEGAERLYLDFAKICGKKEAATASDASIPQMARYREALEELRDNALIQRGDKDDGLICYNRESFIARLNEILAPSVGAVEQKTSGGKEP